MRSINIISDELQELNKLNEMIDDASEGPEKEAAKELHSAHLERVTKDLDKKCDNIHYYVIQELGRAKYIGDEGKRLSKLGSSIKRNVDGLKEHVFYVLKSRGVQNIVGDIANFKIRPSGGKIPVLITDQEMVPNKYRAPGKPEKELIRDALLAGVDVPGCKLGERGEHLRWK